jgi:anti-sigma factor RsiW
MSDTPVMTCRAVLTNISGYLDGELDRTACVSIERHCQQCASCGALVESLRATIGLCRHAASEPLPAAVRQRARDRVRQLLDEG